MMYYLLGFNELIKTLYTLSIPYAQDKSISKENLRFALREYYSYFNPKNPINKKEEIILIDEESDIAKYYMDLFGLDLATQQTEGFRDIDETKKLILKGYNLISQKENQLIQLFNLVVDNIFITTKVKDSGSAPIPTANNLIWIQPPKTCCISDIEELLIHEFTHLLLYLDEQCYGHYQTPERLFENSTWIASAIRNEKRPINAVVHSILVSYEILMFRIKHQIEENVNGLHGNNERLSYQIRNSLNELLNKPDSYNLLSKRMKFLLGKLSEDQILIVS